MKHTARFGVLLLGLLNLARLTGTPPIDWAPFEVAGQRWARGQVVYPDELMPRDVLDQQCAYFNRHEDCLRFVAPYVSPPLALPIGYALSLTGFGPSLVQLVGVGCLTYAVHRMNAGVMSLPLLLPALLAVEAAQNAPLLAAAALAPPGVAGVLIGLCVAFKVTPILLVAPMVLFWRQRLADLATLSATLLVLLAVSLLAGGSRDGWLDWYRYAAMFSAEVAGPNPANIAAPVVVREGLLIAFLVGLYRAWRRGDAGQAWRLTWAAWPLLLPLSWWFYGWPSLFAISRNRRAFAAMAVLFAVFSAAEVRTGLPAAFGWGWMLSVFALVLLERDPSERGQR